MHIDPTVGWFKVLFAILVIGMVVRLITSRRIGLFALIFLGVVLTYGLTQARSRPRPSLASQTSGDIAVSTADAVAEGPPAARRPPTIKRPPKPRPAAKANPGAPPIPMKVETDEAPPAPPVAAVAESVDVATPSESAESVAPLTLYHGWSTTGHAIDSLPAWVTGLENAAPGSDLVSFSSDRFATVEEAEKQLWDKARKFVVRDLVARIPEAVRWAPSNDLLKSHGLVLERCVERTSIEVGRFKEPMFRVHWKALLSSTVRESVVAAWRPTIQNQRLEMTALGFLGATALLAFVNVILRLAPCRKAAA